MKQLLLLVLLSWSISSQAALLLEPVAGYSDGKLVLSEDVEMSGISYGGRVGYGGYTFQIAYDFLKTNFDVKGADEDLETTEHGLFLGLRFWHMRLFATYMVGAKATIGESEFGGGDGPKFGVNFYLFRNLALEASFREVDYDDLDGDISQDYGYKAYFVGLSFPFELWGGKGRK